MKITCPNCHHKFEPDFVEDNYVSGHGEDEIFVEDECCSCTHCNLPVWRSEIDECEDRTLALEELRREHPERFDDEESED